MSPKCIGCGNRVGHWTELNDDGVCHQCVAYRVTSVRDAEGEPIRFPEHKTLDDYGWLQIPGTNPAPE